MSVTGQHHVWFQSRGSFISQPESEGRGPSVLPYVNHGFLCSHNFAKSQLWITMWLWPCINAILHYSADFTAIHPFQLPTKSQHINGLQNCHVVGYIPPVPHFQGQFFQAHPQPSLIHVTLLVSSPCNMPCPHGFPITHGRRSKVTH